ncbi:MAG TPA: hypothetical protein VHM00_01655 [Caldimonas sp.]|jgi:hypothetical protein|nr:hypothetical protein [Caldimonas sp.]HEX2539765.1 hypothetical protein [Caldimonas sp.]
MKVPSPNPRRLAAAALLAPALLVGCASTQLDAQWSDPQLATSQYLRGARVLVACDTFELVLRQICQDQLAAEVSSRGGTPVFPPASVAIAADRSVDAQLLPAAREVGAKAVMVLTLAAAATDVSPGVSVGFGGFGFGRHSGVGVGLGVPIGGGRVTTGYTANGRLTDVQSGRLVWTAKATAPPSSDVNAQIGELSKSVLGAADQSGLF